MIKDPFYRKIIEALTEPLNGDLFERCAADLLRNEFPTLVPIPGGQDQGIDGVTAGSGPFLVATTTEDVIGNLTTNLDSYLESGNKARPVIVATSQELSSRRRQNLEKRAQEKGFRLMHTYTRSALADRLYRSPHWCKELLRLVGRPSALSAVPITSRPLTDHALIGRDDAIEWLLKNRKDKILYGVPGSGKTSLLRQLVFKEIGLLLAHRGGKPSHQSVLTGG